MQEMAILGSNFGANQHFVVILAERPLLELRRTDVTKISVAATIAVYESRNT